MNRRIRSKRGYRPCRLRSSRPRHGTSFAEVTVATMIVGMLIVAALKTLGGATQAVRLTADNTCGQLLAEDLMAEILGTEYAEPTETSVFGFEDSESGTVRSGYDDVDDYNGWSASPPQAKDGTSLNDKPNWRREVVVRYVDDHDLTAESASDQGVKEITVKVYSGTQLVATLTSIKTNHD